MKKKQMMLLIALNFALYVSLGLPDSVIGASWPVIHEIFGFSVTFLSTITVIALCFSLLSSLYYPRLSKKFSSNQIIFYSMLAISVGLLFLLFAPTPLIFLLGIPFLGIGQGAIDVAVNSLLARKFSAKVMNFVHAFYGLGVTLSSAIAALSIKLTNSFRLAVFILLTLHLLIFIFYFVNRGLFDEELENEEHRHSSQKLSFKQWFFPLFHFVYAIEQVFGLFIASFAVFLGYEPAYAATIASVYWLCLMIGRFISGFLTEYLKSETYLFILLTLSLIASLLLYFDPMISAGLLGLGFSGLYPTAMTLPYRYLEAPIANQIVGRNVSGALLGTLLLPILTSSLISSFGFEIFPIFCLLFVFLLAVTGIFAIKLNEN